MSNEGTALRNLRPFYSSGSVTGGIAGGSNVFSAWRETVDLLEPNVTSCCQTRGVACDVDRGVSIEYAFILGLFVCCLFLCKQGTVNDTKCRRREYILVGERGLYRSSPDRNGDSFETLSPSPGPVLRLSSFVLQ
jgi:hypothetical protein